MYYIFITNNLELGDQKYSGKEITDTLLNNNYWLFSYSSPNFKKIKPKDKVIVYIAGKGNRYFYATFEIKEEIKEHNLTPSNDMEKLLFSMFPLAVQIDKLHIWGEPLNIKDIKEDLEFITNKKNYGLFFRQSTKAIDKKDYNLIVSKVNRGDT